MILSICLTLDLSMLQIHSFDPRSISLQGYGIPALLWASSNGHTEAIKALLTAPNIDVNYVDVSLHEYLPTPPPPSSWE